MDDVDDTFGGDGSNVLSVKTTKDTCRKELCSLARQGSLIRVLPGVYLSPNEVGSVEARCHAVAIWDPDAVIMGRAAAFLTFDSSLAVHTIEVATRRRSGSPGYRLTQSKIDLDDIVEIRGLRLTSPAVTAIDLAAETNGNSIDAVLRSRMATLPQLRQALNSRKNRKGNQECRRLLLASRDNAWSAAEREGHRILRRHHVTGWVPNQRIKVGTALFYVDIVFPGQRVAVEIDGYSHHSSRDSFTQDRIRHNALTLAGWTVLHFSAKTVFDDPDLFIRTVMAALGNKATAR